MLNVHTIECVRMGTGSLNDHGRLLPLQSTSTSITQEAESPSSSRPPVPPSSFLCPIHLDIMTDPVTLHTGMTYDRTSIETWLTAGHNTCPVTNQSLRHQHLIPNSALRRAILAWCTANPWPSPSTPVDLDELTTLLGNLHNRDTESSLQRLAGVLPHLSDDQKQALFRDPDLSKPALASHLSFLLSPAGSQFGISSFSSKVNAAETLHTLCALDLTHVTAHPDAIAGLTLLLSEEALIKESGTAGTHSLLKCLFSLCRNNPKNRVVAVECQAVPLLFSLMIPGADTPDVELCCGILESLANCAEGREAIRDHPLGVATVVESLLGVSDVATEHAVGALWAVVALAGHRRILLEVALQAGVLPMLLMVMSSECSARAKGMAREMLKMLNDMCDDASPNADYIAAAEVAWPRRRHQSSKKMDTARRNHGY